MPNSEHKPNPQILQFRKKLDDRVVRAEDLRQLEVFRTNPKRTPEDCALADEILAECERLGEAEIGRRWLEVYGGQKKVGSAKGSKGPTKGSKGPTKGSKGPTKGSKGPTTGNKGPAKASNGQGSVMNNKSAAGAHHLGEAFHNPYTFLPFPPKDWFERVRRRRAPTPLTIDEVEPERFTGIIEIELKTLSPLMTCHPQGTNTSGEHQIYEALTSRDDVIVPATGVRGSLRTLMSVLAGGTLSYLDDGTWLVQGRDRSLGPMNPKKPSDLPTNIFLARVVEPGTATSEGVLELGTQRLIDVKVLERLSRGELPRPRSGKPIQHLWIDKNDTSISSSPDGRHEWKLKLSGRPVSAKNQKKREGAFLGSGKEITVPAPLWAAYLGRHKHGDRPELRVDDLVWLEPADARLVKIDSAEDIASIQWARWGRRGERLHDVVESHHPHMLPDSVNVDGLVDEVTDLFGQVPMRGRVGPAGPFAARVRPDNLVFRDAKAFIIQAQTLAPLAPPHPGCAAFYRDVDDLDMVANEGLPLRGYKVYRNTKEQGQRPPWLFASQGVYENDGKLKPPRQKVNKTCDLLPQGLRGRLRLSCRSLSDAEVALVLLACSVDWRLGGGKPLGLGHCRPCEVVGYDELGEEVFRMHRNSEDLAQLPDRFLPYVSDLLERREMWHQSQLPVQRLRYPRAVKQNRHRKQRGGHVWFQRHAALKKGLQGSSVTRGLEVLWLGGALEKEVGANRIRAQMLPRFDASKPDADVLYGYDLFSGEGEAWVSGGYGTPTYHHKLEPFDPETGVD